MVFTGEVEYRMAKWVFANLFYSGKLNEDDYHRILNCLLDDCNPPMKSIEERYVVSEREEDNKG